MKRFASLFLALILLLMLPACGGKDGSVSPGNAADSEYPIAELTVGTTAVIEKAIRGEYNYDMLASATTEPPLVRQDANGNYHPLLASFSTEDATTWVYTVVDGLQWDDGVPVTAADILFTLQYEDAQGSANLISQTDSEGNTTPAKYVSYSLSADARSISLTLAAPNVRELSNMTSFRVMPKHLYEGHADVSEEVARVGCGPYRFVSFDRDAGVITFKANPSYPEKPGVGKLEYRLFGNEDTLYLSLQNGDIDMTWAYSSGVAAAYQDILAASDAVSLLSVSAVNAPAVLGFNNASGFFSDENLRLAVSYALDYSQFRALFGSPTALLPQRGFAPPATVGYSETEVLTMDLGKAMQYMAAAGYGKKSGNSYFADVSGKEAGFTLTYNAEKESHAGCAELIKTQLEAFGIHVTLDGTDKDSYNAKTSNKFSGNRVTMEAALYGFTAAGMGMGSGLGSIYADGTHSVQGGCQVFDPAFKAILDGMAAAQTVEEYVSGAAELQAYYAAHVPMLALYWDDLLLAHSAKFTGFTPDCVFGLNNVQSWFTVTAK